jgi:hypothetical protein
MPTFREEILQTQPDESVSLTAVRFPALYPVYLLCSHTLGAQRTGGGYTLGKVTNLRVSLLEPICARHGMGYILYYTGQERTVMVKFDRLHDSEFSPVVTPHALSADTATELIDGVCSMFDCECTSRHINGTVGTFTFNVKRVTMEAASSLRQHSSRAIMDIIIHSSEIAVIHEGKSDSVDDMRMLRSRQPSYFVAASENPDWVNVRARQLATRARKRKARACGKRTGWFRAWLP